MRNRSNWSLVSLREWGYKDRRPLEEVDGRGLRGSSAVPFVETETRNNGTLSIIDLRRRRRPLQFPFSCFVVTFFSPSLLFSSSPPGGRRCSDSVPHHSSLGAVPCRTGGWGLGPGIVLRDSTPKQVHRSLCHPYPTGHP